MGQADIAYMIQRIYEKYNATQEDKKYEDRVYMGEDEFRYNLEEMVKKSPIDDKSLLYKEIYRNISESSLEIDSNGTITISPKLIVAVEKEIQMQQERENGTIASEESEVDKKDIILGELNVDAYEELSKEEKDDLFYDSAGWMFGSREEAAEAREEIESIEVDTTVDAAEVSENMRTGKPVTPEEYKKVTGDVTVPANEAFRQSRVDLKALFQGMLEDNRLKLLFTQNNGKAKINMPFLDRISEMIDVKDDISFKDVELILNNIYIAEKKKNPDAKRPSAEQIEGLRKLFQDKDKFVGTVKMLQLMGRMDKDGQAISRMDNPEMQQKIFAEMFQSKDILRVFDSFTKEFKLNVLPGILSFTDNQYSEGNQGPIPNGVQFGEAIVTQALTTYNNYRVTKSIEREAVIADKRAIDESIESLKHEPIMEGVEYNAVSSNALRQDIKSGIGLSEEDLELLQGQGEDAFRTIVDRTLNPKEIKKNTVDKLSGFSKDVTTQERFTQTNGDARIFIDKAYNPHSVKKSGQDVPYDIQVAKTTPKTVGDDGDTHVFIDKAYNPQSVNGIGGVNLDALDAEIDASFAAIGDGGDDMFADMFAGMAEDMAFGGSAEVEHEPEVDGEGELVEDAPIGAAAASGLVAEDVVIDEPAPKVNEVQAPPVINEPVAEVVEEPKSPEQPGMLAVDTLSNKIKRGLNELGKKVKGIFGKVAGLFGGGSNDSSNNTGTNGTGGIVQDDKSPKTTQAPGQDFIQHVDLKFDFLKNDTAETRTDPTKPKGVDDQTQGFEVDD